MTTKTSTAHVTNPDGTLHIAEWAKGNLRHLAPATVPMFGTPALARPLVTDGEMGVDLIRLAPGEAFTPHTHPGKHILVIVGGVGTITFNGRINRARAGQVYLIGAGVPHAVGAVTHHAILSVGAPHKAADDPARMQVVEYAAVATSFGELTCEACTPHRRTWPGNECPHFPPRPPVG